MSATYEQRRALVAEVVEYHIHEGTSDVGEIAEEILDALDHIPENVDWVCQGQPRDPVKKGAA